MPKKQSPPGAPFLNFDLSSVKSQEKIAILRKYYNLGLCASSKNPDGTAKRSEPISDLAAEIGVQADTVRKALKFATTYTGEELEAIRQPNNAVNYW